LDLLNFFRLSTAHQLSQNYLSEVLSRCVAITYYLTRGRLDLLKEEMENNRVASTEVELILRIIDTLNLEIFHKDFHSALIRSTVRESSGFHILSELFDKIASEVIIDKHKN